jgi:DNA helicase-2/ATP-dependent DNA helicase PcrA
MQDKSIRDEFIKLRKKLLELEFSRMNDKQREAVFCTEGPLLILAGAGSGKTTVLVNRIANLVKYGKAYESSYIPDCITDKDIEIVKSAVSGKATPEQMEHAVSLCKVDPCPAWRILAITFTNKAAEELKVRISNMLGYEDGNEVLASTFHSFCARILRRDGDRLGYTRHFTIYDTDDSRRLMKDCMRILNIEEKVLGHKTILNEIGRAKDSLLTPDQYMAQVGGDFRRKQIANAYTLYQRRLMESDAMDFDDLLFQTVRLFSFAPDVLEKYQNRFRYMMVDEYQDTNHAQFVFISMLAKGSGNLCVVGDDDQSIYKFRGATIENILGFEQQFNGCRVIRLEQNYRSTKNILNAANAVIAKNQNRKVKTLWTENPEGEKIEVHRLRDEDKESRFVLDTILDGVSAGRKFGDFAVLYRVNAQANALERTLAKSSIPYRIIGGHRFFDSIEIRDAMAYLKVINNPNDTVALQRIINQPKRGIGDVTLQKAANIAEGLGISLYDVLLNAEEYPDISRAARKIKSFTEIIENLRRINDDPENSIHFLYTTMLETTGYKSMWEQAGEIEVGRVENLDELASSIIDYEKNSPDDFPELAGFLEEAALMTDVDNYDAASDAVVLMTMHAAKGLEFPVVFLPGFEDGIFPGMQTIFNPEEMEEDRRLCYVAITRAKEKLYILNAESRMLYGSTTRNRPSRFLSDIPDELIERFDNHSRSSLWSESSFGSGEYGGYKKPFEVSAGRQLAGGGISASGLQENKPQSSSFGTRWQSGDIISHKVFGKGKILSVTPMGNDFLLEIQFEKVGIKKVMANFAKLVPYTN